MRYVFCCDFKYCDGFLENSHFPKSQVYHFPPPTSLPFEFKVCLQQCQTSTRKANFIWYVFKSACQFHYSSENGFKKCLGRRGGILRVRAERVGGGRSRRPGDIPSRLSDSHLPPWATTPTARCPLLYGTPAAPPLLPPSSLPQSCPGDALCLHSASGARTRAIPTPPSPRRAVERKQIWQTWAMALLLDGSPVTAAYFCLLRRRFKRRRKKRSERKGTPAALPRQRGYRRCCWSGSWWGGCWLFSLIIVSWISIVCLVFEHFRLKKQTFKLLLML